jgi:glycosyltransferase involved in cell wall biosynthesis
MRVAICLPAFNEAASIAGVLDGIPKSLPGVEAIDRIVVDDGSTDATAAIAQSHGAIVVRHAENRGTGSAFVSGVQTALRMGVDVIVTMDSDGQFDPRHIPILIAPLLRKDADVVLCTRFGKESLVGSMPWRKRAGNWLLSRTLSAITGQHLTDVSCGFRAFTTDAALRVDIHSNYEYIHESLLNWGRSGLRIQEISVSVLAERPVGASRVMASVARYAVQSAPVLIRAMRDYSPMKFFGALWLVTLLPALVLGMAVSVHWLRTGETAPYTSFIPLSVGGVVLAFLLGILALIADLIGRVRYQIEELLYESRKARVGTHRAGASDVAGVDVVRTASHPDVGGDSPDTDGAVV